MVGLDSSTKIIFTHRSHLNLKYKIKIQYRFKNQTLAKLLFLDFLRKHN